MEQLVAMFSPLNLLQFESLPNCVPFVKLSYNENKTIDQENFINFVAVAIVSVIVLGHPFNKRVVF